MVNFDILGRYYYPCFKNFYTFGEVDLGVGFGGSKTVQGNTTVKGPKASMLGAHLIPGFAYFISPSVALEMTWERLVIQLKLINHQVLIQNKLKITSIYSSVQILYLLGLVGILRI